MERYLTVNFFKRLIVAVIIAIILGLTTIVVFAKMETKALNNMLEASVDGGGVIQSAAESLGYQSKYPNLHIDKTDRNMVSEKGTVYLTFDDGPSTNNTEKVLDVLKSNGIKATFFIVYKEGEKSKKIIQRIIDEGHTIGIHSYSHDYGKIYESVEAYLDDFYKLWNYLKTEFDYKATVFRFPGGTVNAYNLSVYDRIVPEMYRRGFMFYDWNVSAQDAVMGGVSEGAIIDAVTSSVSKKTQNIVLMHDSSEKDTTVGALPEILKTLKERGYTFKALDNTVTPITFVTYS